MAGLLADVFSYGDTAKRKLKGLLADPVGTFQQFVGNENDRAGQFNQLTSQATDERVNRMKTGGSMGVSEQRLAGLLADAYNPMGMVVWHGSPHKFAKFDSSKIGTGEGAQAYGHGLYLAESPEVAQGYQTKLAQAHAPNVTETQLQAKFDKFGDWTTAVDEFLRGVYTTPKKKEAMRQMWIDRGPITQTAEGSLYKVDLPDEHIAKMLDWDKPLSQQPKEVQSWLHDPYNAYRAKLTAKDVGGNEPSGSLIVNRLQELMSEGKRSDAFSNSANFGSANASRELKDYGIPGIRYFDGGSRGTGQGTSNFVVFPGNENLLQILERNGKPLNGLLD